MVELQEYVELHDLVYLWEGTGPSIELLFLVRSKPQRDGTMDKGVRERKNLGLGVSCLSLDRFRKTRGRVNVAAGPPRGMRFSQSLLLIVMEPLLS